MIERWSRYFLALFFLLFCMQGCGAAEERRSPAGSRDAGLAVYAEAVDKIRRYAIFVDPNERKTEIAAETVRAYLQLMDPYSDYLTPDEYATFKQAQRRNEVGLGLNIVKGGEGAILCFPIPAGPAEAAGVRAGDRLEAIDGVSVRGKSLFAIAAMARGKGAATVTLTTSSANGQRRAVAVTRSALGMPSVAARSQEGITVIRIATFTAGTRAELDRSLKQAGRSAGLVLDVRGNGGGDLTAAIDSARLFLKRGSRAVLVKMRSGLKSYDTAYDGPASGARLFLWQDGRTASAAEAFVAALTGNGRAVSIGERSYGKGSRQDVVALADGSALVLTTGYLETPGGVAYDRKGLAPAYPVRAAAAGDADYLALTRKLMQQTRRD